MEKSCIVETNPYCKFIYKSRYARWDYDKNRREEWPESIDRLCNFWNKRFDDFPREEIFNAIYNGEVMPSMRSLMTAGPALEADEVSGYNCAFLAIDDPKAFDEILYILSCGTGVGFSVERQFVQKLPTVAEEFYDTDTVIVVRDSKIGWATALRELISLLYAGKTPTWDTRKVRPAGSLLKTFGGRASGPGPLEDVFRFAVKVFHGAMGRKLTSLECHDLVCKIAESIVSGGVRRSALISLSNLSDDRMRDAKSGAWWDANVQRTLANNSAVYTEKPEMGVFIKEWKALYDSKSGERGIFNRKASLIKADNGRRTVTPETEYGTNPCGEILLKSMQFCNLSEVVVREDDSFETLKDKVRIATILGTFQSTLVNFRYLRAGWRKNCEEERLLGVSLTGNLDHPVLGYATDEADRWLDELKLHAIEVNAEWAAKLRIPASVAITCNKPSGTVSQLMLCASGIHGWYSRYYIRTVRMNKTDPLARMLQENGVPCEDDVTKPTTVSVFSFPIQAPACARLAPDISALEQLKIWKMYRDSWCEHNPSATIYVKEDEWMEVGAWVYKHFDEIGGLSFLPYSDHVYKQAPYQPCSETTFQEAQAALPIIPWAALGDYETEDYTTGNKELACTSGACSL